MTIVVGSEADLTSINQVVTSAAMSWPKSERAKRLVLPVLSYTGEDFNHYKFLLYQAQGQCVGVAVIDTQMPVATARGSGRLLHGLYVAAAEQGRGYGQTLLRSACDLAAAVGADGIVVKAERVAIGFFEHCGLQLLPASGPSEHPYQFWYQITG
jgi:GNAT superfamily N-acetyltransferase